MANSLSRCSALLVSPADGRPLGGRVLLIPEEVGELRARNAQ
jgi:hypothetical protein